MNMEDKKMITIEDFMTSEPYTLCETDSINDAWGIMIEKHIRHIPVIDDENHVLGLITQRDVLAATEPGAIQEAKSASHELKSDVTLAEIMTRDVKLIHKEDSLRQAALYLQSHKFGCLPVISGGSLVGIITDSDFIDIAINLLEQAEITEDDGFAIDDESDQELANIDLPEIDKVM